MTSTMESPAGNVSENDAPGEAESDWSDLSEHDWRVAMTASSFGPIWMA